MEFEKGKKVKVVGNISRHKYNIGDEVTMYKKEKDGFKAEEIVCGVKWGIYFSDCEEIEPETKPHRYKSREVNGMDVIDLVKHWNLNFNEGNVLKYLLRDKGQDIEDLEKIIDYAQRELKHRQNEV